MADKLGISKQGFPNVAVYDAESEYLGRVVGFGGIDPWMKQVKEALAMSDKIRDVKAKAEAKPEQWVAVADLLMEIPDRSKDALEALEKVPAKKQKSKVFKAAKAKIEARAAWGDTESEVSGLMKGVRRAEGVKRVGPDAIAVLEKFLKAHKGADDVSTPAALAKKGFFLNFMEKTDEAMAIAKELLNKYPDSKQAKALLRGLR